MTDEIPTEALQAAARAYDRATYGEVAAEHDEGLNAAVAAAAPFLIAEGRRQYDQQMFAPKSTEVFFEEVDDAEIIDETPALTARYERKLRCKIAAEIRGYATPGCHPSFLAGVEWAAGIAEGNDHGS